MPDPTSPDTQSGAGPSIITPEISMAARRAAMGASEVTRDLRLTADQRDMMRGAIRYVQQGNKEKALALLASTGPDMKTAEFEYGNWDSIVKHVICTEFDASGSRISRKGSSEASRLAGATHSMDVYLDYIKNGYENLSGGSYEKMLKQEELEKAVEAFLHTTPTLLEAVQEPYYPHNVPKEVVRHILSDERLRNKLTDQLSTLFKTRVEATSTGTSGLPDEAALLTSRKSLLVAQHEQETARRQKTEEEARRTAASRSRTSFSADATYKITSMPTYTILETRARAQTVLEDELSKSTVPQVTNFRKNLDRLSGFDDRIAKAPDAAARAVLETQRKTVDDDIKTAIKNATHGTNCSEFRSLYDYKRELDDTIRDSAHRIDKIGTELVGKDQDVLKAKVDLDKEVLLRQKDGGKFSRSIEQALGMAMQQQIAERAQEFTTAYHTKRVEAVSGAGEQYSEQVDKYLEKRWINYSKHPFLFWGRLSLNRGRARRDLDLLAGQGPDGVLKDVLKRAKVPEGQIALLMENEVYKSGEVRKNLIRKVLTTHIAAGGRLSDRQVEVLALSSWSQEALKEMLNEDDEVKGIIEKLREKGEPAEPADIYRKLGRRGFVRLLVKPMKLIRTGVSRAAYQLGKKPEVKAA